MNFIGKKFEVDFGMAKAILHIESETLLTFTITEKGGENVNVVETVQTKMTELRPQLYLVTWQEKSGTTVTQVHDYENETVYSNWTSPDGEFNNLKGALKGI
ncbi:MoaF-related domain-containing protein [Mucilaginibacter gilvus]|uniref:MoaF-like domain-containing protein n=1 Tax=Mucilaginibacter gilvus TaxID=2305909 RepID=A0A444MV73_9SPHI|nr:hypothetical protein [Mucilaginibacter gilvus]RWY57455.1 hypothetical protein EPL05_02705 [Mucilaginibacter gilvus]